MQYALPDPAEPARRAERKAIGEQIRAATHALVSLSKLGPTAFLKACASLLKQLEVLAHQKAHAMSPREAARGEGGCCGG